jgi:hypothetical protein
MIKPLQPQSSADFCSPLEDARTEIDQLKTQIAAVKKEQSWKCDQRVLDLQLRNRAHIEFLRRRRLLVAFQEFSPHNR